MQTLFKRGRTFLFRCNCAYLFISFLETAAGGLTRWLRGRVLAEQTGEPEFEPQNLQENAGMAVHARVLEAHWPGSGMNQVQISESICSPNKRAAHEE